MKLYRRYQYQYHMPERLDFEAKSRLARTVEKELERNLALQLQYGRLSPASNIQHLNLLKETHVRLSRELDALDPVRKKAAKVATSFTPTRFLQAALSVSLQRSSERARKANAARSSPAAKASAADSRNYVPGPQDVRNARTVFGTDAHFSVNSLGRHYFKHPYLVVPCVQRAVRKEVLFAIGQGGKAHRSPHQKRPYSHIWC